MAGHHIGRIIGALIVVNQISTSQAACYYPNGGLAPNDVPCQDVTTHSACCGPGYACLTNGICQATGNELLEPGATEFVRGSCTDKDWRGSGCPAFCINPKLNNLAGGHGIGKCTKRKDDMYYCIDAEHNEDSCGTNDALFFPGTPSAITTIGVTATTSKPATTTPTPTSTTSAPTTQASSTDLTGSVGTTPTTTPSTSTATSDPATTNTQPQSNNTAMIAGVVAGVLGGIILGGLAVWTVIRIRKRRKSQSQQNANAATPSGATGHESQQNSNKSASHNWYMLQQEQQQHNQTGIGGHGYGHGWNGNGAGPGNSQGHNAPPVYHEADHGAAVMELPANHRW